MGVAGRRGRRRRRPHRAVAVDPHVVDGHRALRSVRRATGVGARPRRVPRPVGGACPVHALDGVATGGRWRRAVLLVRPARPVRPVPRSLVRLPPAVHDVGCGDGADVRVDAVPRDHRRGRARARSTVATRMRPGRSAGAGGTCSVVSRVPTIRPALVAGAVLAWARALGEFGATITFAGNFPGATQTMPLATYLALETDPQEAVLLSLVLIAVSFAVLVSLRDRWLGGVRPVVVQRWSYDAGGPARRRRRRVRSRRRVHGRPRRGVGGARPERGGQDHAAARRRRPARARPRAGAARWRGARRSRRRRVRPRRAPADRRRVPAVPAVRPPHGARERGVRAAGPRDGEGRCTSPRARELAGAIRTVGVRPRAARRPVRRAGAAGRAGSGARHRPAACCCSTSRSPRSTSGRVGRCAATCASISRRSTACACSSRTIRSTPTRWPIGWPSSTADGSSRPGRSPR